MAKGNKPLQKHHVTPKSRVPEGIDKDFNNIVMWDADFHAAWHYCFQNMTVEEVVSFIRTVTVPGGYWGGGQLERMRKLIMGGEP